MALNNPVILEAEEIGSPVTHIRVKWNDPAYGTANAATGFKLIHDDETGTLPAWTSAVDAALAGGGDGAGNYEVLMPVPLGGVAFDGETFASYPLGEVTDISTLNAGGLIWNGAWDGYAVPSGMDSFDDYSVGVVSDISTLNGGDGWGSTWNGQT